MIGKARYSGMDLKFMQPLKSTKSRTFLEKSVLSQLYILNFLK